MRPSLLAFLALVALGGGCSLERGGLAGRRHDDGGQDGGGRDADAAPRDGGEEAGCTDDDGDGTCAELDCDDGRPDVGPGATERCLGAAPGVDEDCDRAIDEGCDWFFGRPSPLTRVRVSQLYHYSPVLSADGRRLVVRGESTALGDVLEIFARPAVDVQFAPGGRLDGVDFAAYRLFSFTLDDAETELIVEATAASGVDPTRLYRAVRSSAADPFPRLQRVSDDAPTGRDFNPHLSRDGTELFFATTRSIDGVAEIWRAERPTPDDPFGEPARLDLGPPGSGDVTPMLTRDGRTLFFTRVTSAAEWQIMMAERPAPGALPFSPPREAPGLGTPGSQTYFPFASEETGEIFFVSNRPWSGSLASVFRARVCRDGPCSEADIDCAGGMRSDDRRHCYELSGLPVDWTEARLGCMRSGGQLATVHSTDELSLLQRLAANRTVWIGGHDLVTECNPLVPGCSFEWVTGEPFAFGAWGFSQPDDAFGGEDCLALYGVPQAFYDLACTSPTLRVCERELWPW